MSKKRLGRPRKSPPKETEFSLWLTGLMDWRALTPANLAAALDVRVETVYGWLAGDDPENPKVVRAALVAIYGEPPDEISVR